MHKVLRFQLFPALLHGPLALHSPVLLLWQWNSWWQLFPWFVHGISSFRGQEQGVHVHGKGTITMLLVGPLPVGVQLLVTPHHSQAMLQVGLRFVAVLSFWKEKHEQFQHFKTWWWLQWAGESTSEYSESWQHQGKVGHALLDLLSSLTSARPDVKQPWPWATSSTNEGWLEQ